MQIVEQIPFLHNFSVVGNDDNVPENLGIFETIDDFQEYFALNTVSEHQKVNAKRWYTDEEIQNFREIILNVVEEELPVGNKEIKDLKIELEAQ
ncbi:hypothetical protein EGI16_12130 [Chryseobacterium sp. G0240]|uniref:hypothetical protein n=1 Tax=Chryseobacterium sp. G0240 TaxID=2487066 RepID=UPI000F44C0B5|nr:hypothetical protein [Chryseobacterium sp. G0240]ROI02913.1 hypothetical protein EGI16_12130 [Chryseobacterium sp. G0240]